MEVKESVIYRVCCIKNGKSSSVGIIYENKIDAVNYCKQMNEADSGRFYYCESVKVETVTTEIVIDTSSTPIRLKQISNLIEILALDNLQYLLDKGMRFKSDNYEIFENGNDYCLMAGESLDMTYEVVEEDFSIFMAEVKKFIIEEE